MTGSPRTDLGVLSRLRLWWRGDRLQPLTDDEKAAQDRYFTHSLRPGGDTKKPRRGPQPGDGA